MSCVLEAGLHDCQLTNSYHFLMFFFSKFFSVPYYWIYVSFVSLQLSITSTAMKEISVLMTRTEWSCWRSISVGGKRGGQPRLRTTAAYIYILLSHLDSMDQQYGLILCCCCNYNYFALHMTSGTHGIGCCQHRELVATLSV